MVLGVSANQFDCRRDSGKERFSKSGNDPVYHFADGGKMIDLGSILTSGHAERYMTDMQIPILSGRVPYV